MADWVQCADISLTTVQYRLLRDIVIGGGGVFTGWQRRSLEGLAAQGLITLAARRSMHRARAGWSGTAEATEKGRKALEGRR